MTHENSKCRLCGDRDEKITHVISESGKLAQKKYKARHNWVGKVIHWELCKKVKLNHTRKLYVHNVEFALGNEMHKLLRDFEIQTYHQILASRQNHKIIKKKENLNNGGLCHSGWPQSKIEERWKEKKKGPQPCKVIKKDGGIWKWWLY